MKPPLALISFLLLNAAPSWADSFHGRIFYTVTDSILSLRNPAGTTTTIPGLAVGDSFTGSYRYESPTIDGLFTLQNGLTGGVNVPGVFTQPFLSSTAPLFYPFTVSGSPSITVAGGLVQSFHFALEVGAFGFFFLRDEFRMGCGAGAPCGFDPFGSGFEILNLVATGTVEIENPTVPEPDTFWMLAAGLASIFILNRRLVTLTGS